MYKNTEIFTRPSPRRHFAPAIRAEAKFHPTYPTYLSYKTFHDLFLHSLHKLLEIIEVFVERLLQRRE